MSLFLSLIQWFPWTPPQSLVLSEGISGEVGVCVYVDGCLCMCVRRVRLMLTMMSLFGRLILTSHMIPQTLY